MRQIPILAILALLSCGQADDEDAGSAGLSKRPLKKEHLELVTAFAQAVVRKDYKAAFELTAADHKSQVGWSEFEKSITRYREAAESAPTYVISATEDDPKDIRNDGVLQIFVPEAQRSRVVEEAAIHFTVKGKTEDDDGFWALICWIVEEDGHPRILQYYQDD